MILTQGGGVGQVRGHEAGAGGARAAAGARHHERQPGQPAGVPGTWHNTRNTAKQCNLLYVRKKIC